MAKVDQYLHLQARNFARFPLALCRSSYGLQTDCRLNPTDRQPISPLQKEERKKNHTHLRSCGSAEKKVYMLIIKSLQGAHVKQHPRRATFVI